MASILHGRRRRDPAPTPLLQAGRAGRRDRDPPRLLSPMRAARGGATDRDGGTPNPATARRDGHPTSCPLLPLTAEASVCPASHHDDLGALLRRRRLPLRLRHRHHPAPILWRAATAPLTGTKVLHGGQPGFSMAGRGRWMGKEVLSMVVCSSLCKPDELHNGRALKCYEKATYKLYHGKFLHVLWNTTGEFRQYNGMRDFQCA